MGNTTNIFFYCNLAENSQSLDVGWPVHFIKLMFCAQIIQRFILHKKLIDKVKHFVRTDNAICVSLVM